ncbi:hypothetical protein E1B28_012036 [Marasmius oreades]|uniref:PUB domain-containing protein n=1 Tax=Marasmius oreades TaxID=181124 RepID=A0A9P7RR80_9AGAR|nr:uncharacterized protein E1B28_012036 [Marasmius oreades]KAG7087997.1 hypothetical protein E1B28_012036 [Marasmius oreades]
MTIAALDEALLRLRRLQVFTNRLMGKVGLHKYDNDSQHLTLHHPDLPIEIMQSERQRRAQAAEERLRRLQNSTSLNVPSKSTYKDHDAGVWDRHEIRKQINTLLEKHGVRTLKTLRSIAENILKPENLDNPKSKYKILAMESDAVKKKITEPAGVKQMVIDMGFRKMDIVKNQEHRVWLLNYRDRLRLYEELLNNAIVEAPINEARRDEDLRIRREREEKEDSRMKERQRFRDDRARVRERCEREKQLRENRQVDLGTSRAVVPAKSAKIHTLSDTLSKESDACGATVAKPHGTAI